MHIDLSGIFNLNSSETFSLNQFDLKYCIIISCENNFIMNHSFFSLYNEENFFKGSNKQSKAIIFYLTFSRTVGTRKYNDITHVNLNQMK